MNPDEKIKQEVLNELDKRYAGGVSKTTTMLEAIDLAISKTRADMIYKLTHGQLTSQELNETRATAISDFVKEAESIGKVVVPHSFYAYVFTEQDWKNLKQKFKVGKVR